MRSRILLVSAAAVALVALMALFLMLRPDAGHEQQEARSQAPGQDAGRGGPPPDAAQQEERDAIVRNLVGRLNLEAYKQTIHGLTQFGDRREGTDRNRRAVDWIEARLQSYGCPTERMHYDPPARRGGGAREGGPRGGRRGRGGGQGPARVPAGAPGDPVRRGAGGKGFGAPTGVNSDPERQPDVALRALNLGAVLPGPVPQVYCTKVGTTRPGEMYILGAHMDGIGYGEAANDDGSGTALVMELARVFSMPDVVTDVSIRFALWNGEEGGLTGSRAYVAQRADRQGREDPAGSGRYPEPRWLGMVQHDMMMWDHGAPGPDGRVSPSQRPEADVNVEFQENSMLAIPSLELALAFKRANERYATDYPATLGPHMQSTDSVPFQDLVPAISLRENERRDHVGFGWDPNWHQPTDVFATYTDQDFRLGLNAAQTTLAAIAQLAGARVGK
jgi:hypothetical protein